MQIEEKEKNCMEMSEELKESERAREKQVADLRNELETKQNQLNQLRVNCQNDTFM